MRNFKIEQATQLIRDLLRDDSLDIEMRRHLLSILRNVENGVGELEDRIHELEAIWNRNPSFPGDWIGNWVDDDDKDDEDKDDTV